MTPRSSRSTREILIEALTHLEQAQDYATSDLDEQLTIDAICMRLSAGIESLSRLDHTAREVFFGTAWPAMWGMRNRIAHGYMQVDPAIVRSTLAATSRPSSPASTTPSTRPPSQDRTSAPAAYRDAVASGRRDITGVHSWPVLSTHVTT